MYAYGVPAPLRLHPWRLPLSVLVVEATRLSPCHPMELAVASWATSFPVPRRDASHHVAMMPCNVVSRYPPSHEHVIYKAATCQVATSLQTHGVWCLQTK